MKVKRRARSVVLTRSVWRKLHIMVYTKTHEIVAVELGLSHITVTEVLTSLLNQTCRKIVEMPGDGAYDTRNHQGAIRFM